MPHSPYTPTPQDLADAKSQVDVSSALSLAAQELCKSQFLLTLDMLDAVTDRLRSHRMSWREQRELCNALEPHIRAGATLLLTDEIRR